MTTSLTIVFFQINLPIVSTLKVIYFVWDVIIVLLPLIAA